MSDTFRELKRRLRAIGEDTLGRRFSFRTKKTPGSFCYPRDWSLTVSTHGENMDRFVYEFFHEIAHLKCYREGKYYDYHDVGRHTPMTDRAARAIIRTGLRAERHADSLACELIHRYGLSIDWSGIVTYHCEEAPDVWRSSQVVADARSWLGSKSNG